MRRAIGPIWSTTTKRLTTRIHTGLRIPSPRFPSTSSPRRGISLGRIPVKSETGKYVVRESRKLIYYLLGAYAVIVVGGGAAFIGVEYLLNNKEPTSSEWPLRIRMAVNAATFFEWWNEDDVAAVQMLRKSLDDLKGSSPDTVLEGKSNDWIASYADILARLGVIEERLKLVPQAKTSLEAAISLPVGDLDKKSRAYIALAKIREKENVKPAKIEHLYKKAIELAEPIYDGLPSPIPFVIEIEAPLTRQYIKATTELGIFYARHKKLKEAFPILLSCLRAIEIATSERNVRKHISFRDCEAAILREYIGEIAWGLGRLDEGIRWVEDAAHEAYPDSRQVIPCGQCLKMSLSTVSKMYHKVGEEDLAKKAQDQANTFQLPMHTTRSLSITEPFGWLN